MDRMQQRDDRVARNADERRRRAERSAAHGDVEAGARVLAERMRAGELTREQVRVASRLGDPRAQLIEPTTPDVWSNWSKSSQLIEAVARSIVQAMEVTRGIGEPSLGVLELSYAIDCAKFVLPLWTGYGDDQRLRRAIEAGARELKASLSHEHYTGRPSPWDPSDNAMRLHEARLAADEASQAAADADGVTSSLTASAAEEVAHAAVAVANRVADLAYRSAARCVDLVAHAAYTHGSDKARNDALAWMQARLVAYVLDEANVDRRRASMTRRRNSDERRRRAERSAAQGDIHAGARVLAERMRSGELTQDQIWLAARLGDPRALLLSPTTPAVWGELGRSALIEDVDRALDVVSRASREAPSAVALSFVIDCASRVLPLWTNQNDRRPSRAIQAGRLALTGTASEVDDAAVEVGVAGGRHAFTREAQAEASLAAAEAANDAEVCVAVAAEQVAHAAMAATHGHSRSVLRAAAFGVEIAAYAVYLSAGGRGFETDPNDPQERAALTARDEELAWMQARLAAYALREVTGLPELESH